MSVFKKLFILLLATSLLTACGSSSGNNSNQIDYASLDSLRTEIVFEVGESENYLPGQLTSLVIAPNGNILVADWASKTIEQFSRDGTHRTTIAQQGDGPGELGNYFYLRNTAKDTIIVSQMISQRDFFVPNDEGIYRFDHAKKKNEASKRSFRIVDAQSDTSYYATELNIFRSNQMNEAEQQDYEQSALVVVNSGGELLQDSVQMYKTDNPLVERPSSNSVRVWGMPFRHDDALAILPKGKYVIARIDSNAVYKYNSSHEMVKKISLHPVSRPITSEDLDYELSDMDAKTRNKIEARTSNIKPPYLNMFVTEKYIWLHTNTSKKGKQIVVVDYEGNPLGKFMLPEVDSIQKIIGTEIYTIHQSPERGHLIRKYKVGL